MIRIGPDRTIGGTRIWIFAGGKLYLREKTTPNGTPILEFFYGAGSYLRLSRIRRRSYVFISNQFSFLRLRI